MFIVVCPHCLCQVEIQDINCGIFRHAIYKDTNEQIPPHTSKEICDRLFIENRVYGCAKPFKIEGTVAVACDYI